MLDVLEQWEAGGGHVVLRADHLRQGGEGRGPELGEGLVGRGTGYERQCKAPAFLNLVMKRMPGPSNSNGV